MKFEFPHRRYNPLTRDWVLVSPHRTQRPWLGQVEKTPPENLPAYDPTCYLCPGNSRAGGVRNPNYVSTFVFDNDFSALLPPEPGFASKGMDSPLYKVEPESGICRVVCFSPRHDLTLPQMTQKEVEAVVRTWNEQSQVLGGMEYVRYVQIFENKGAVMGASNPHPHSQIWASSHIPNEPARELSAQEAYFSVNGSCLLCNYVEEERGRGERLVASNDSFTALVPFWAIWPFETLVVAHRHIATLKELDDQGVADLADILRRVTTRYDNLFEISFPYSMGFHQAPTKNGPYPSWHLHAHFYPPLLRSATVRKFMVGYEMLGMPQRDITPETAAERLRSLSEQHFLSR